MASIRKRGNKFNVVYYFIDDDGEKKQKWETYDTFKEAQDRKIEIESKQKKKEFVAPKSMTVHEFLDQFIEIYGTSKWGVTTFRANTSLIGNYINPLIGDVKLQDMTKLSIDMFYKELEKTPAVEVRGRKVSEFVTSSIIVKIDKLLSTAFRQAKLWGMIEKNPTEGAIRPKVTEEKREIWEIEHLKKALENCQDNRLYLAINLSFACSLRLGECLGITWDCLHINDEEMQSDDCWVNIEKELTRVNVEAANRVGMNGIIKIFPSSKHNATTCMVLKEPKTETSKRKVYLPTAVAKILRDWKEKQDSMKELLGNAYLDYDLVIAHNDGRPCDLQVVDRNFKSMILELELPEVVFHSLRHLSTTYKLKLSNGDVKTVQGDTGHASSKMVMEVYSHILDEDRKKTALSLNEFFYNQQPDLRKPQEKEEKAEVSAEDILNAVKESEELREQLKKLLLE